MDTSRLFIDHTELENEDHSPDGQSIPANGNYGIIDDFSDDIKDKYIVLEDHDEKDSYKKSVIQSDARQKDELLGEKETQEGYDNENDVQNADEMEKVIPESSDIIGGSYSRETYNPSNPRKNGGDALKNVTVSTQHVARVLNVTEQTIRNYCREFSDFLNIDMTGSGRMRFTNDDIERLRYIMFLKDDNNFTMDQLKEYLSSPDNYSRLPERERLDKFASQIENKVLELISAKFSSTTSLLEENSRAHEEDRKQMQELIDAFQKQSDELCQLKEDMKKIDAISSSIDKVNENLGVPREVLAEYQNRISLLEKENERLQIDNANKDKRVHEQEQVISELSASKKRKKLFGFI